MEKPWRWSLWRGGRCNGRCRNFGRSCRLLPAGRSGVKVDGCYGTVPLWCSRNEDFIAIGFVESALLVEGLMLGKSNMESTNLAIERLYAPRKMVLSSSKCWAIHGGGAARMRMRMRSECGAKGCSWGSQSRAGFGFGRLLIGIQCACYVLRRCYATWCCRGLARPTDFLTGATS